MANKKLGIIAGLVFVLIIGVGIYFSFMRQGDDGNKGALLQSGSGLDQRQDYPVVDEQYNYSLDMETDVQFPQMSQSFKMSLKGLKTIAFDKFLKSRFAIKDLDVEMSGYNNDIIQGHLSDIDLLVQDFILFAKISPESIKGLSEIKDGTGNEFGDKILSIIKADKYIKIDNSKYFLTMLGELGENELVRLLVEALGTNDPIYYLEKNDFWEKITKDLFVVGSYKFLFNTVGEADEEGKTILALKSDFCETGLYSGIAYLMEEYYYTNIGSVSECKQSMEEINGMINENLYLYQSGNTESIIYNGLIDFSITYGEGNIKELNIQKQGIGKFNYDNKIIELNMSFEILSMMGMIDPEIDIDISAKYDLEEEVGQIALKYNDEELDAILISNFDLKIGSGDLAVKYKAALSEGYLNMLFENNKIVDRETKVSVSDEILMQSANSRIKSDLATINRSVMIYLSDDAANPEGKLSTGGLVPVYYNGELISYQGFFDEVFVDSLNDFDQLHTIPTNPIDGNYYLIGVSKDLEEYNISGLLGDKTARIEGNLRNGIDIELSSGSININSLIYPGDIVDGKYLMKKSQLTGDDYLEFIENGSDANLLYSLDNSKFESAGKFIFQGKGNDITGKFLIDVENLGEKIVYGKMYYDVKNTTISLKVLNLLTMNQKYDKMEDKLKFTSSVSIKSDDEVPEQIKIQSKGYFYNGTGNYLGMRGLEIETKQLYQGKYKSNNSLLELKYLDEDLDLKYTTEIDSIKTSLNIKGKLGEQFADLDLESNVLDPQGMEMGKIEGTLFVDKLEKFDFVLKGGIMNDTVGFDIKSNYENKDLVFKSEYWGMGIAKAIIDLKIDENTIDSVENYSGYVHIYQGEMELMNAKINANLTPQTVEFYTPLNTTEIELNQETPIVKIPIVHELSTFGMLGGAIAGSVAIPEFANQRKLAVDASRIANLNQLMYALSTYYSDNGLFPQQEELGGVEFLKDLLVPAYIDDLKVELDGRKIYYASLFRNETKQAGMILIIELDNEERGNFDADSIDDLWSKIQGKDVIEIQEMVDSSINSKFYVIVQ